MEEGIESPGAQIDFETILNLEVNLVSPARLALEEAENDEVKMVLHQSLSPRLVEILIQATPELEASKPNNRPLMLSRFLYTLEPDDKLSCSGSSQLICLSQIHELS